MLYLFSSPAIKSPKSEKELQWSQQQRAIAGALLARLAQDQTNGARVVAVVQRLMPVVFLTTLVEDPLNTVRIFDSIQENPELIWTDGMRAELRCALEHLSSECALAQEANPLGGYQIADSCEVGRTYAVGDVRRWCRTHWHRVYAPSPTHVRIQVVYPQLADELCIGGVYIRLLLEQPAWQLHHPKEFLEALLQAWVQMVEQNSPDPPLGPASQALIALLQACRCSPDARTIA